MRYEIWTRRDELSSHHWSMFANSDDWDAALSLYREACDDPMLHPEHHENDCGGAWHVRLNDTHDFITRHHYSSDGCHSNAMRD